MSAFDPQATGPVIFKASAKSQLALTRKWLWLSVPISLAMVALTGVASLRNLAIATAVMAAMCAVVDWLLRRQLKPGLALVTLHEDGIESTSFPGRILWRDVAGVSVEMVNNVATLQLQLRSTLGHADRRNFWNGRNAARPAIVLTPFSAEDQQALFDAVRQHLLHVSPEATTHNPLVAEREFQERLKALAPMTWVTYALVAVNVGVWALMVTMGADALKPSADLMLRCGGNTAYNVQHGQWWRLLTATFLHGGAVHLVMNMLGLWVIGQTVERIYGHRIFLLMYLCSGLLGSALSLHFSAQQRVSVGASGAIFGIAGALLVAVLQHRKTLPRLFGKQMLSGMGFFILYSLAQGFANAGIDNAAHVGGLIAGGLMAVILPERFDMAAFVAKARSRTAVALVAAVTLTGGIVALAPAATVDLQRAYAGEAAFQQGMTEFNAALKSLGKDAQNKKMGKISALDLDERGRTVHAPAFKKLNAEFTATWLPPEDVRSPTLVEVRRFTALLAESLAMASVVPRAGAEPEAVDPARMKVLEDELTKTSARMSALAAELTQLTQQRKR